MNYLRVDQKYYLAYCLSCRFLLNCPIGVWTVSPRHLSLSSPMQLAWLFHLSCHLLIGVREKNERPKLRLPIFIFKRRNICLGTNQTNCPITTIGNFYQEGSNQPTLPPAYSEERKVKAMLEGTSCGDPVLAQDMEPYSFWAASLSFYFWMPEKSFWFLLPSHLEVNLSIRSFTIPEIFETTTDNQNKYKTVGKREGVLPGPRYGRSSPTLPLHLGS